MQFFLFQKNVFLFSFSNIFLSSKTHFSYLCCCWLFTSFVSFWCHSVLQSDGMIDGHDDNWWRMIMMWMKCWGWARARGGWSSNVSLFCVSLSPWFWSRMECGGVGWSGGKQKSDGVSFFFRRRMLPATEKSSRIPHKETTQKERRIKKTFFLKRKKVSISSLLNRV